ncbi:MAG: hypothetical protein RML95_08680 [Anaerolineae bacterium]|nr:hypothetical protein [Anaerolineae bacterium]
MAGLFDDLDANAVPPPAPPRNRTFLILAIILILLIAIGLVVIILAAIDAGNRNRQLQETRVAIEQTNQAVFDALTRTTIAQTWTRTPTPTSTPTNTPEPTNTPTNTPTPTVDIEATEVEGTRVALLTQTFQVSALDITRTAEAFNTLFAQQTQNAAIFLTLTAQARDGTIVGTPIFVTPTPIGFLVTISPSPTFGLVELGTPTTPLPFVTIGPEGIAVPTRTPTPRALPEGGFFDDIGLSSASPSSLPAIGLLALGLLAIIFVARRLRMRD